MVQKERDIFSMICLNNNDNNKLNSFSILFSKSLKSSLQDDKKQSMSCSASVSQEGKLMLAIICIS